ncbi:MAG TPA: polysaccharide deacetylase family protein [Geminicoccaceae bacterium]|nr:polysaccharide deacetylase family protein [Geminicoccaceae bacterium]
MARDASGDRPVLIPHVDDLGVSHGANQAFVELAGLGFVTCGSVMPPCGWFPEMAAMAQERPALDVGVHLTLTSESRACRWRPISTASPASGLLDGDGYLWPDVPSVRRHADRGAVETELRAQIEAALAAGIDVTHLDTHMGAAAAPEFAAIYVALGRAYRLPVLLTRESASYDSVLAMGSVERGFYDGLIAGLAREGVPLIDRFAMGLAMPHLSSEEAYRRIVGQAAPGTTFVSLHCNTAGDIEVMHPNDAAWRIAEYELFKDPEFLAWTSAQAVRLGGFRAIRDRWREDLARR